MKHHMEAMSNPTYQSKHGVKGKDEHLVSNTDPENTVPIFFGTGNGIHFLAFSVSLFSGSVPVRYGTGKIPNFTFKYRYRTDIFRYWYPVLTIFGIGTVSGFTHPSKELERGSSKKK
ncbi:hypothetical protein HanIR_Chr14g0694171 [Helianthus annuus]|nr:hypothetical protein HanIR_Chr14g0694171 [Helianthus annuus]